MKLTILFLVAAIFTTGAALAESEVDRLRALIKEQEGQIQQLELKISRLTDSPVPDSEMNYLLPPKPGNDSSLSNISNTGIYTVVRGDSLARIANRNQVSQSELSRHNNLSRNSIIHPDQQIRIPGKSQSVSSSNPSSRNKVEYSAPKSSIHRIKKGETFYRLSIKYGITVDQLIAANPKVNYRALNTGQKIRIPGESATVSNQQNSRRKASQVTQQKQKPRTPETPVKITEQITYQQFAGNYNTTTSRLDELNGLSLDPQTVLAEGSELYIPR